MINGFLTESLSFFNGIMSRYFEWCFTLTKDFHGIVVRTEESRKLQNHYPRPVNPETFKLHLDFREVLAEAH
jgi:hypothetical protein